MIKQANRPNLKQTMQRLAASFKMEGLTEWVDSIEDPLDYDDLDQRQLVIQRNLEALNQKIALLQHFSNIDPLQAKQYVENAGNFEYSEWQELESIKQDLNDYEKAVNEQSQDESMEGVVQASRKEVARKGKKNKKKMGSPRGWIPS